MSIHPKEKTEMDFIERIFGVAPDGGDGTTEILYIAAVLAVLAMVIAGVWLRRRAAVRRR
ncbi:MAG: hypothetical protein EOS25_03115 [Mesorhizobium sp.]|uniref:hypothetical protein n=1 Tax=Mesorhizobium sp. TaxID=1871066 RepID=UPI000FE63891|nr:hypothetical protein [Mesorhizobium sp.]RWD49715.1 MAG: hypothetical protein EOS59_13230 [Mesorhizobium sp.]RWF07783.1 MAG: hypothetical protein EOS69_26880 [Mesorhizobium sp.]RWF21987.1 MAG: hypothetical protein EOS25_03115 [Mesorhizobium sp.]